MGQAYTEEEIAQVMQDMETDRLQDIEDDRLLTNQEFQEGFGPGLPDEKHNAHTFLNKATFESPNTLKTTFLSEPELGRPDFSVRFLQSIKTVAEDLINPLAKELDLQNGIAHYFKEKIENITSSGMSNKGFSMNLNVTRRMDARRERSIQNLEPMKGGKQKI